MSWSLGIFPYRCNTSGSSWTGSSRMALEVHSVNKPIHGRADSIQNHLVESVIKWEQKWLSACRHERNIPCSESCSLALQIVNKKISAIPRRPCSVKSGPINKGILETKLLTILHSYICNRAMFDCLVAFHVCRMLRDCGINCQRRF